MDLKNFHQKLEEIEILRGQGKNLEADILLHSVQKDLKAHPLKDPRKYYFYNQVGINGKCEECGVVGEYTEQSNLCNFCYIKKHNNSQGDASKSGEEFQEEWFDEYLKLYEQ
ncbi:MAG: hypothetical protein WCX79_04405 [Candidatus Paceibacterota bacterium]|jgi:uncharacterized CHY-type Zn-finger protein